jgi:class 3 adenylate cyclase
MRLFVAEYTIDRNATRAYRVAFPDVKTATAATEGWKLLRNPKVRAKVDRIFDETLAKLGTSREKVLGRMVAIAMADPNELMELRLGACECCWGGTIENKRPAFWTADPDPDCTACAGEGMPREHFHDTRTLSPTARALYAGVKRTKDGLQVLTHSQDAAREALMKHFGLYEKDNEQKADPLRELLKAIGSRSSLPVVAKPSDGDA